MFSFHKPKVYRSTQGCCICKAKSSSSRFTDSKKYEDDFIDCFQLSTPRRGEICNACVLLVKRFKRLPPGSERHWSHVVDARIGPGIKSMTKFKKRKEEQQMQQHGDPSECSTYGKGSQRSSSSNASCSNGVTERFGKIFKKTKKKKAMEKFAKQKPKHEQSPGSSDENSSPSSPMSNNSDGGDDVQMVSTKSNGTGREILSGNTPEEIFNSLKCYEGTFYGNNNMNGDNQINIRKLSRKSTRPRKNPTHWSGEQKQFVDSEFWMQIKVCCGHVYENRMIGALLIDTTELSQNMCPIHKQELNITKPTKPIEQPMRTTSTVIVTPATLSVPVMQTVPLKKYQHFTKRNPNGFDFSFDPTANTKTDSVHTVANEPAATTVITSSTIQNEQISAIDYSTNATKQTTGTAKTKQKATNAADTVGTRAHNYLHKLKLDSGRVVKSSLDRLTPSKFKPDLNVVKNLVRLCTDRTAVNKKLSALSKNGTNAKITEKSDAIHNENENNCNKIIEALAGNKFSDNSSDSGYDETLHDTAQLNQIAKVGSTGPVILSNGVKIHVQPQNLLYAANLAGVSQSAIETTQASLKASLLNQQTIEQQLPFGTNITPMSATGVPLTASVQSHILPHASAAINNSNIIHSTNDQILYTGLKQKALPLAPVVNNN